jgi:hypothetical protein
VAAPAHPHGSCSHEWAALLRRTSQDRLAAQTRELHIVLLAVHASRRQQAFRAHPPFVPMEDHAFGPQLPAQESAHGEC